MFHREFILTFCAITGNASTYCAFGPFQVIPYSHNEAATEFFYDSPFTLLRCALHTTWVKFPDNATEMELPWLNDSYVHLNGTNKVSCSDRVARVVYSL